MSRQVPGDVLQAVGKWEGPWQHTPLPRFSAAWYEAEKVGRRREGYRWQEAKGEEGTRGGRSGALVRHAVVLLSSGRHGAYREQEQAGL